MTLYIKTPHQIRKSNNESESRGSKPVATKQTASKATEALQGSEYQKFMKIVSSLSTSSYAKHSNTHTHMHTNSHDNSLFCGYVCPIHATICSQCNIFKIITNNIHANTKHLHKINRITKSANEKPRQRSCDLNQTVISWNSVNKSLSRLHYYR